MLGAEEAKTPKEFIERIRAEDYLLDINDESDRVKRGAKSLHKKLNNALKLLSDDLYSKKSHFVLELIQNADDNDYHPSAVPHLTFKLAQKRFVLINNEVGFSEKNVQALCSVGDSSKANKSGYIGEKGIGFKSVFTVSNAPEIHSNGYHFRFDQTDESNLLGYVVPEWCEPPVEASPDVTTIILPAADNYSFSQETLKDLDARLLLFLSKVRQIGLHHDNENVTYRRRDKEGLSYLTTETKAPDAPLQLLENRYVRVAVALSMANVPDEKRPDVLESSIVLAFPVDSKGAASPEPSSQVFAFLPIRQVGFKFSIQADFILSSSREDILTDRPWNKLLRNGISLAFKKAVESFKKNDELAFSFLRYFAEDGEISDPFFKSVSESILNELAQTDCLPSAAGPWKRPSDLRLAGQQFRDLFPSVVALELFGFDYVDKRVQGSDKLLNLLGAKTVTLQDTLNIFKLHGNWLKQQSLEWKARFYAYVADIDFTSLIKAGLASLSCVPTNTGDLVIPELTNVFYPLSKGKKYGFEHELVIVDNELVEQAQQRSERVQDLFALLKVKSDAPFDLVTSHILPKHQGDSWKTSEHKALIGHLRYVKDKVTEYLKGATVAGKSEAQPFQFLREGMWLGTKHNKDGSWLFARANKLYLSKEYKPHFCIESLLGGLDSIAHDKLVSPDYIAARSKEHEAETESWRQFFQHLGVCFSPNLQVVGNGDWQCSDELQLLLSSPQSSVRKATLECLDQYWSQYANRLTYNLQIGRTVNVKDTKFVLALRSTLSPTKKKTSVPLSDAFYLTQELLELFGDRLPFVDATLSNSTLDACRIAYRLDAKACIRRLMQLKAEGGDTVKQLQAIYRHLERLWDSDSAYIKQTFTSEGLIRIKGAHSVWDKPSQFAWRSNGSFLDSLYPPLQGQYRDFSGFFHDKLGIPRELPTAKWVEALSRLGTVESVEERRREALAIYKRANRDLTPRFGRDDVPIPEWLDTFEGGDVFLNQRDELVTNDEQLFANDAPELASLFSDDPDISLLGVLPEEVPRIGRLLDAANVQRLSASVVVEVVEAAGGRLENELTSRVRRAAQYLGRVLYAKSHDSFESALEKGLFVRLRELEVVEVPELKLSVSLGQTSRITTADIAQSPGKVLFRAGARSIKDQLAAELCRYLGAPEELADTFARVLMEENAENTEDFLKVRNIGPLPPDLQGLLDGAAWPPLQDDAREASEWDKTATEQAEDDEHPSDQRLPIQGAASTASSPSHTPATNGATIPVAPPSTPVAKVFSSATINGGTPPAPAPMGSPASDKDDGAPGADSEHNTPPKAASDLPYGRNWGATGGTSVGSRPKRGQSHQHRTKTGRLMSYAASPGDSDRPNAEDDPAKAAAREATGKAAVEYFIATQATRWKSLTPMPHNNPGFDVYAIAHDGSDEFIEVKGQSAAWTEDGVALTPTELMTAQQKSDRYWLCVVEHVHDEKRRALYLLQNPYGLTQQFRFDSGWKSAAISEAVVFLKPEAGLYIDIPKVGRGRIQSVHKKGRFFSLHVILEGGRQVNKLFNPATMKLSAE